MDPEKKTSTACRVISGGIRGDDGKIRSYGDTIEIANDQVERLVRAGQVEVIQAAAPAAGDASEA